MHLDDLDWDILDALQVEGRIGYRELGRRVGLSAPAVAARIRKLEKAGIISGYRAAISPSHLGLRVEAFVQMAVAGTPGSDERVIETARSLPEISDVWRVTGRETYLLRVVVPVVHDLERVLRPLWEYGETTTGAVLSAPLADRPITREMARAAIGVTVPGR
ncbi:MAG: Lrp/AsnC family transcriptional regulator [Actinobacteria bacterium]|nr:Lrp/AsnC family transcriptional regulator [Actinomycetota bacterium]MBU1494195.1 Lrp/AsnC family transcriptional regulator [Actinomycetota bacterium]MBU1865945.1 Lrp/AsnC family transcriptional regulator [Actinomycetota bacterium]